MNFKKLLWQKAFTVVALVTLSTYAVIPQNVSSFISIKGSKSKVVLNEIIVKLKAPANNSIKLKAPAIQNSTSFDAALTSSIKTFGQFKTHHKIRSISSFSSAVNEQDRINAVKSRFVQRSKRAVSTTNNVDFSRMYKLTFDKIDTSIEETCKELASDPAVEYAVPNNLFYTQYVPTDPLFSKQWSHILCSAESGWNIEKGSSNVVVAIVDCGVDYNHEDLAANIVPGYDFVNIDTAQYVAAGYTLCPGEDYTTPDANPMDYHGHGTHCAGIVAAAADNGVGVVGVAPGVKIMPVRAGFSIKFGSTELGLLEADNIANAIRYAADNGADIINMSFGGSFDQVTADAVAYAVSMGVFMVAAAGNNNTSDKNYPAALDNVISVAAVGSDNKKAYYSSYGPWVNISAPGGNSYVDNQIFSTVPHSGGVLSDPSGYRAISGTSMAAPYISGVVALILSRDLTRTVSAIKNILLCSVDSPVDDGIYMGVGRVNVYKAVQNSGIGQISISSPLIFDTPKNHVFTITGTVQATIGTYQVSYGKGIYPIVWNQIASGSASIINGTLAQWNVSTLNDSIYNIRVTLHSNNDSLWTTVPVVVDNELVPGWPQMAQISNNNPFGNGSTLGDINKDSLNELFVLTNDGVYAYNHDGTPLTGWPFICPANVSISGWRTPGPTIGDIDGDGNNEIVFSISGNLYVLNSLGQVKSGFPVSLENGDGGFDVYSAVHLADLNNDGKMEMLVKHFPSRLNDFDRICVFSSNGQSFENWPYIFDAVHGTSFRGCGCPDMVAVDIDHDGNKEVIGLAVNTAVGTNAPSSLTLFVWNYDGTIRSGYPIEISQTNTPVSLNGISPIVADIDNDGAIEVGIVLEEAPLSFAYFSLNGVMKSGWPVQSDNQILTVPLVADFDGDGKLETVISGSTSITGHKIFVVNSNGSLRKTWQADNHGMSFSQPLITDIDGDTKLDIIVTSTNGLVEAWNDSGRSIQGFPKYMYTQQMGQVFATPSIGDFDGDHKSELVATTSIGNIFCWDLKGINSTSDWPIEFHDSRHTALTQSSLINPPINSPCTGIQGGGRGLKGTVLGVTPCHTAGSEYCKATDGNTSTFYNASWADSAYTGLDLGSVKIINKIKFYPRVNFASRMTGGQFQGSSTSNSSGYTNLYTILSTPATQWDSVNINNQTGYRWVRYLSPIGGYCNVAEIEFYTAVAAVQCTLKTNATNGIISLNPTGGHYLSGTVVTVTATPNSGYVFSSWSGNLSGSTNPTTITMSTNKSITANFVVAGYTFEAESLTRTSSSGITTALDYNTNFSCKNQIRLNATGANQYIEFTLPNISVGTYGVKIYTEMKNYRGKFQAKFAGTNISTVKDEYYNGDVYQQVMDLGKVTVTSAGNKAFRMTVTGKNSASTGYWISCDKITLK
jgi:thermitase